MGSLPGLELDNEFWNRVRDRFRLKIISMMIMSGNQNEMNAAHRATACW